VAAVEPGRAGHGDAGGEKTVTRSVKSGERPDDAMKAEAGDEILGLTVEPLAAGIRPGDAILEVDRGARSVPVYLQRGGGTTASVMLPAPRPRSRPHPVRAGIRLTAGAPIPNVPLTSPGTEGHAREDSGVYPEGDRRGR